MPVTLSWAAAEIWVCVGFCTGAGWALGSWLVAIVTGVIRAAAK